MLNSPLAGRTAGSLDLRWRYGINLLAVARHGARVDGRLSSARLQVGDVLLLQGKTENLPEILSTLGCLPLAEREVALGSPRRLLPALGIFGAALGAAATGLAPVQIAFITAAVAMVLVGVLCRCGRPTRASTGPFWYCWGP
jgi:di/tricarboxylate transporter